MKKYVGSRNPKLYLEVGRERSKEVALSCVNREYVNSAINLDIPIVDPMLSSPILELASPLVHV
jgi:hypothetical protein